MLRMKKYILISLVAILPALPLMAQTSTFAIISLLTLGADKLASPSKEINNGIKTIKKINNTAATSKSLYSDYERTYQKNH